MSSIVTGDCIGFGVLHATARSTPPASRTYVVATTSRIAVPAEVRVAVIPTEPRTAVVPIFAAV